MLREPSFRYVTFSLTSSCGMQCVERVVFLKQGLVQCSFPLPTKLRSDMHSSKMAYPRPFNLLGNCASLGSFQAILVLPLMKPLRSGCGIGWTSFEVYHVGCLCVLKGLFFLDENASHTRACIGLLFPTVAATTEGSGRRLQPKRWRCHPSSET